MALRILVAEDQPLVLEIIADVLTDAGHEVLEAENGTEALRISEEEKPDVLLLDVMMPGMDGREITRRIRADPSADGTRIVLYSAMAEEDIEWEEAGADAFRSKTESVRDLPSFLERLANSHPDDSRDPAPGDRDRDRHRDSGGDR